MFSNKNESKGECLLDEPVLDTSLDEPQLVTHKETEYKNSDDEDSNSSEESSLDTEDEERGSKSDIYVVVVNDVPTYYCKTEKMANLCMWDVAREAMNFAIRNTGCVRSYVLNIAVDELHVECESNWYIITYPEVTHRIRYFRVQERIIKRVSSEDEK